MTLPSIENAYQNIKSTCDDKLLSLFPAGVPSDIQSRYEQECAYLNTSEYLHSFELYRRLAAESKKCSSLLTMRGTVAGSFIFYLLSNGGFNPLPVYYYCEKCGYYENVNTHLFGIDLPSKKCPTCGYEIDADGYNLSCESVWGNDGKKLISFEYNVCSDFLPFAKRVIESIYPNNPVVPLGMFKMEPLKNDLYNTTNILETQIVGYAILPNGNTIDDYPYLISYLENGDPCITGEPWVLSECFIKPIRLYSLEPLENLLKLQRATGIYAYELSNKELRNITWGNIHNISSPNNVLRLLFQEFKPKSYKDMIALEASTHNSFSWREVKSYGFDFCKFKEMLLSESFQKYPCYTREDIFDYLIENNIERTLAYTASEQIRKGYANSSGNLKKMYSELPLPSEVKEVAANYYYIFPRAHSVEYMLIYAKLAYYAKIDSRVFSKIMYLKK